MIKERGVGNRKTEESLLEKKEKRQACYESDTPLPDPMPSGNHHPEFPVNDFLHFFAAFC